MRTLANSEDPDETPLNAKFHQCLHCLLRQYEICFFLENITCDTLIYTLDHPKLIISNQKEISIGIKRFKSQLEIRV